jgi:hypothetical protein
VLEWQGERFERTLNKQITSNFSAPERTEKVKCALSEGLTGTIIFSPWEHQWSTLVRFMVDTGAIAIAMTPH